MAVTPVTTAPPAAGASGAATPLTNASEQHDRFMRLLVAQMRNQDPLNPLDNAQMTSQVAQINTVAGLEKLNASVGALLQAFGQQQAIGAAQLAGRQVLVESNNLVLADGRAVGGVTLAGAAVRVDVQIIDAAGRVVRNIAVGPGAAGTRTFEWDGTLDDGSAAAPGTWRMRVSASAAGQPVEATGLAAARVRAVVPGADGGASLDLGASGLRPLAAVRSYL